MTTQFTWEVGTAYDMFTSLDVLNDPSRYGVRGAWAAGVRSRLPVEQRDLLQKITKKGHLWPIPWITTLTGKKDGQAILKALADIPAADRIVQLSDCFMGDAQRQVMLDVVNAGAWQDKHQDALYEIYTNIHRKEGIKKKIKGEDLRDQLEIWAKSEHYGAGLLTALETFYEVFFAEEEVRIRPILEEAVVAAKAHAAELPLAELLNELSQGLRFDNLDEGISQITMIPSFWITPFSAFLQVNIHGKESWLFVFGGRPAHTSLVPGQVVPDLLSQTLKALADPTRLRILRYLSTEPMTPAELSRRLRLRAPTVVHHLHTLRLARLVHLTFHSYEGRRYEARREAITAAFQMLETFLDAEKSSDA